LRWTSKYTMCLCHLLPYCVWWFAASYPLRTFCLSPVKRMLDLFSSSETTRKKLKLSIPWSYIIGKVRLVASVSAAVSPPIEAFVLILVRIMESNPGLDGLDGTKWDIWWLTIIECEDSRLENDLNCESSRWSSDESATLSFMVLL